MRINTQDQTTERTLSRAAFTLMEMLVVVAIIVILAGVGVVLVLPRLQESKEKVAYTRIKGLETAVGGYEVDNGRPATLEELLTGGPTGTGKRWIDPEALRDPWGNPFQYDPTGQKNGGVRPDIWCQTPEGKIIGNWPQQ